MGVSGCLVSQTKHPVAVAASQFAIRTFLPDTRAIQHHNSSPTCSTAKLTHLLYHTNSQSGLVEPSQSSSPCECRRVGREGVCVGGTSRPTTTASGDVVAANCTSYGVSFTKNTNAPGEIHGVRLTEGHGHKLFAPPRKRTVETRE